MRTNPTIDPFIHSSIHHSIHTLAHHIHPPPTHPHPILDCSISFPPRGTGEEKEEKEGEREPPGGSPSLSFAEVFIRCLNRYTHTVTFHFSLFSLSLPSSLSSLSLMYTDLRAIIVAPPLGIHHHHHSLSSLSSSIVIIHCHRYHHHHPSPENSQYLCVSLEILLLNMNFGY